MGSSHLLCGVYFSISSLSSKKRNFIKVNIIKKNKTYGPCTYFETWPKRRLQITDYRLPSPFQPFSSEKKIEQQMIFDFSCLVELFLFYLFIYLFIFSLFATAIYQTFLVIA